MNILTDNLLLLDKEMSDARNNFKPDRLDMSFGELMSMYERGELEIKPAFQRYFRWDQDQQTRFIESILLGIPIPPIFVATDDNGTWELVDGLQRLSTIISFFGLLRSSDKGIKEKNNWVLGESDRLPSLKDLTYETLPNKYRLLIKRSTCRVEILRWSGNYDMRFELFNRLNTGGSPLTPQEIRNCIYRDISPDFNNFIAKLAKNEDFKEVTALSDEQIEQLYDEELVLRFLSLYQNSNGVKTSIAQHMTSFMKHALENPITFDYEKNELIFNRLFARLKPLGKEIFRQDDKRFATALYDVITVGIAENYDKYSNAPDEQIITKINTEIRTDATLLKFSRRGGNNQRTRILNRLREGKRIFGTL